MSYDQWKTLRGQILLLACCVIPLRAWAEEASPADDPEYNSILLLPTTETLPKGDTYFRVFELVFLNLGVALSDDLNLSFGGPFPVSKDLFFASVGFKYRLLAREEHRFGLAVTANWLHLDFDEDEDDDDDFGFVGLVGGFGDRRRSVNLCMQKTFGGGDSEGFMILAGADRQIGRKTKLVVEYVNNTESFGSDEDFSGFINLGVRWFGESMSFTLTGMRPLLEDTGDLIFVPLAAFSKHW